MKSPLSELFGQLFGLFAGIGLLAAIFFDPLILIPICIAFGGIAVFYNYLESSGKNPTYPVKHHNRRHNQLRGTVKLYRD